MACDTGARAFEASVHQIDVREKAPEHVPDATPNSIVEAIRHSGGLRKPPGFADVKVLRHFIEYFERH